MGQQQLLLLVLGIVIVGLAVVVGIQAFSENQKQANADQMVNDAIRIAFSSQYQFLYIIVSNSIIIINKNDVLTLFRD